MELLDPRPFLVGLVLYVIASLIFCALLNFKYHDRYGRGRHLPTPTSPGVPADAFLVDLHAHTNVSDGLLTPAQLVAWSISNGYDGLVVSDHNTMDAVGAV